MNVTDGEFFLYKNRDRCEKGYMLLREIAHFRTQKRKILHLWIASRA